MADVGRKLGLEGTYIARSYIEQVRLPLQGRKAKKPPATVLWQKPVRERFEPLRWARASQFGGRHLVHCVWARDWEEIEGVWPGGTLMKGQLKWTLLIASAGPRS